MVRVIFAKDFEKRLRMNSIVVNEVIEVGCSIVYEDKVGESKEKFKHIRPTVKLVYEDDESKEVKDQDNNRVLIFREKPPPFGDSLSSKFQAKIKAFSLTNRKMKFKVEVQIDGSGGVSLCEFSPPFLRYSHRFHVYNPLWSVFCYEIKDTMPIVSHLKDFRTSTYLENKVFSRKYTLVEWKGKNDYKRIENQEQLGMLKVVSEEEMMLDGVPVVKAMVKITKPSKKFTPRAKGKRVPKVFCIRVEVDSKDPFAPYKVGHCYALSKEGGGVKVISKPTKQMVLEGSYPPNKVSGGAISSSSNAVPVVEDIGCDAKKNIDDTRQGISRMKKVAIWSKYANMLLTDVMQWTRLGVSVCNGGRVHMKLPIYRCPSCRSYCDAVRGVQRHDEKCVIKEMIDYYKEHVKSQVEKVIDGDVAEAASTTTTSKKRRRGVRGFRHSASSSASISSNVTSSADSATSCSSAKKRKGKVRRPASSLASIATSRSTSLDLTISNSSVTTNFQGSLPPRPNLARSSSSSSYKKIYDIESALEGDDSVVGSLLPHSSLARSSSSSSYKKIYDIESALDGLDSMTVPERSSDSFFYLDSESRNSILSKSISEELGIALRGSSVS